MPSERTPCTICLSLEVTESTMVRCNVREFRDQEFNVWRCGKCGCLHSQNGIDIAPYYKNYPFKRQKLDFAAKLAYRNRINGLIRNGMEREHSILDFGCGSGLFLDFLRTSGYRNVFGYDAFVDSYSNPSILAKTFDVVTSQDVVEHFDNPREFFNIAAQCISPGGMLAVGTPNAGEISLLDTNYFLMELHQPYHRHLLTESNLIGLGEEQGLKFRACYNRFYYDTIFPTVNTRFIKDYVVALDNDIDVAVEPPQIGMVLKSPKLWLSMFLGYYLRSPGNVVLYYQKPQ